ncbi:MAG: cytochrome ubiquinol oxidase subunit I [Nitrospirae bacterium]|nr:cytochrome ubiquinol oxidase subunit I [Nitrospirota bacterium]
MDVVFLSRLQFALTVGFHFIFVSINMGMAWLLVVIEALGWRRKDGDVYVQISKFYSKLFGLTFVVGIATGIVMEFQFGTNWESYSRFTGNLFGVLLSAEVLAAFFLESVFLGLYLFGRERVSKGVHWLSILLTAAGTTLSAFWILAANSWQQTPAGHIVRNGTAEMVSFMDVVFNPSTLFRFLHTVDATLITGTFFMAGVSAYLLLQDRESEHAKRTMRLALTLGLIFSVIQVVPFGHEHAIQVAHTQPEKFAVFEGIYRTRSHAPLVLFGIPTTDPPELRWEIGIPGLLSLITFGDVDATIQGINEFPADEIPPLILPFIAFRMMVFLGLYFILIMAIGTTQLYRKRLWGNRVILRILKWSLPLPIAASELGWIAAEVGRQPWAVYRALKTEDAVSAALSSGEALFSLILFGIVYIFIGIFYIYVMRGSLNSLKQ